MGKVPFFLTGGNAKIILNNKTVAYATDISYTVTVNHASPRVLGRFEVETIQPLTYDVEGSLSIIRYGRGLNKYLNKYAPKDTADKGNSIGSYGPPGINLSSLGLPNASGQFDGGADENFNPVRFFQSKMFNIEIRQKLPIIAPGSAGTGFLDQAKAAARAVDDILLRNITSPGPGETSVVLLRDCRFTSLKFDLTKTTAARQTYTFKARYMDDDTNISAKSGVGQELS